MEENIPQNTPKKGNSMMWVILVAVVIIALAAILYFGDFFNTNTNSNTNAVANTNTETNSNVAVNTNTTANQNTNTVSNTNSATNTNTKPDTSDWQTYNNSAYEYTFQYPTDWRIAESYMSAFASVRHPQNSNLTEDYVVLTKLSQQEENDFISYAQSYVGIAARPWYDFGQGRTVIFSPSTATLEDYKTEVPEGTDTITLIPSNVRQVTLSSGTEITRLQRYEKTDNGEFTYEIALFPVTNKDYNFLEVRIETNGGSYESVAFDNILHTITIK